MAHMGYSYPNHKGNYYYRNPTLYHIGTLDSLGVTLMYHVLKLGWPLGYLNIPPYWFHKDPMY